MKKTIVLGCNDGALGVIRSLANHGIKVMALYSEDYEAAQFSRFVSRKVRIRPLRKEGRTVLNFLVNLEEEWDGSLLVPTNDISVEFVSRNREELSSRFVPAVQDWEMTRRILDKGLLYRHAQEMSIPMPKIFFPGNVDDLKQIHRDINFPCIIKPCESQRFFPVYGCKLLVIEKFEELIEKFVDCQQNDLEVVVSDIIPGPDDKLYYYTAYIDGDGGVTAEMCMQKLRQYPPGFGNARIGKTVPIIPEIRQLTLSLLKSYKYRGFGVAEFKFDSRDKQYKLMEINVRPVLQTLLFTRAGINFPYLTYMDFIEGSVKTVNDYRSELYWIDLYSDLIGTLRLRKKEHWSIKDYVRPYMKRKVFSIPLSDDPLPFIMKGLILLNLTVRSFFRRLFDKSS
jgi:predicted ATP-grasp superfamily ATP-dependent carboligase